MIEQTSIQLSESFIDSIQHLPETNKALLILELMNHTTLIERMLGGYYFESRGNIYGLSIEKDCIIFNNNLTGTLKLQYNINYFMGCQDLTYDDKGVMRIYFEINTQNKTIILTGENIRERDPDIY